MKIDVKKLIISILIPLGLGIIFSLFSNSSVVYKELIKPPLAPPSFLFPIVWSILYILMGVSAYLVSENSKYDNSALVIYAVQLFVNLFWTIIFFNFRLYFLAFFWLVLLLVLIVIMLKKFYQISKLAFYLQIPYLVWVIFAGYLNLAYAILN